MSDSDSGTDSLVTNYRPRVAYRNPKLIDDDHNTKLHYLAAENDVTGITKYLERNVQLVDPHNYLGWTPLMMACRKGYIDAAKCLLSRRANATKKNKYGMNVFQIAIASGNLELVVLLLEHLLIGGISRLFLECSFSVISLSILFRHQNILEFLLGNDFDIDRTTVNTGGLAAAKEASSLGAKVALIDYVRPTPFGTTWGLSGTSVNVGCIPKKLMHQAALLGEAVHDAKSFGWQIAPKIAHNWQNLTDAVQAYIKSVNWVTRVELRDKHIKYINGMGSFEDPWTVKVKTKEDEYNVTAKYFLIAVGSRPKYPNISGALEYGITSDDIFNLKKPPGKTIIIGAGYVGLECAGVLNVLGYDTTVMVRSVPLRGFDRQMAMMVTSEMENKGVKFISKSMLKSLKKLKSGMIECEWANNEKQTFDTVMFAIGRQAPTKELQLEKSGVKTALEDKIVTNNEQTNVSHIYAVGDVLFNRPHSTPIAIYAGKLLSRRLFGNSGEIMDYENTATTIFTPLEYGFVGLSEETAIARFGAVNIEVYHNIYKPPEFSIAKKSTENCYLKVIAMREGLQKILGMHFIGPQAGEVIQGFSTAIKCNLTVDVLMNTIGIHPTLAEEFTKIRITKRSGQDPTPTSCCS